jgi:hypothetical protein
MVGYLSIGYKALPTAATPEGWRAGPRSRRAGTPWSRPEDFVVAVAVERSIEVDQVHAAVGQLAELFQAITTVDNARIE